MTDAVEEMVARNAERQAAEWQAAGQAIATLLGRYLLLWRPLTSSAERRSIARSIFADDGWYKDTMTDRLTPDGLADHIEANVFPVLGELEVRRYGTPLLHGSHIAFSWQYADQQGAAAEFSGSFGTDFVTLTEDSRIASLVGFFDAVLTRAP